jgi:peptide/nickel transport system substrate-binding protein
MNAIRFKGHAATPGCRAARMKTAELALVLGLVLAIAGCGASSSKSATNVAVTARPAVALRPATDPSGEILTDGVRGGTLTVLDHGDFQHFDPAQSYYQLDYAVIYATQRPLYTYAPTSSTTEVPDLASSMPVISGDGTMVTVHIQHGVHFSPPVDREVTSADVAYAIERGANPHVENPYLPAYFYYIVGASKSNGGPIAGITTPDRYTIVFRLTGPYASFFVGALALPLSAPVPREYAAPMDAKSPTQYGACCEVATGPYMMESQSTGRFLGLGYKPGESLVLVRNPNWRASTYTPLFDPPAYLNRITVYIGGDQNVIGQQVLLGSHSMTADPLSPQIVKLAYRAHYHQLMAVPGGGGIAYVALNNAHGPFSNVDVRKAFWAALDRRLFLKTFGGPVAGQVATHFIYPGSLGFSQAGGYRGPQLDYNADPDGSLSVARKYMRLAGYTTGRYSGPGTVTMVGSNPDWIEVALNAAQALGFHTRVVKVDQSVVYSKYCGVPAARVDICPTANWIRDWADPQTILDTPFAGYNIVPTNNSNYGLVSVPDWPKANGGTYAGGALTPLDQAMRSAEQTAGATARTTAWAKVDERLVDDAVAVPTLFLNGLTVESTDVRGIIDAWYAEPDFAYTSLK